MTCFNRHTHELVDQIFSRISLALSRKSAMTFLELCAIVRDAFTPKNNVLKLERTWNIKDWLTGDEERHIINKQWKDITEGQQFLFEPCTHSDDGKPCPTVPYRAQEYSSGPYGPKFFPLKNLPIGRPLYNAARTIFSRWDKENRNQRTSDEQAKKDFEKSKSMICDPDGKITAMRYVCQS